MQNLSFNLARYGSAKAVGYIWGADCAPLKEHAPHGYDLLLLSDLIFNHQAHPALIDTLDRCLHPQGQALVFFSHHRPHMAERDLAFFTLASQRGYICEKLDEWLLTVRTGSTSKPSSSPSSPFSQHMLTRPLCTYHREPHLCSLLSFISLV